MLHITAYCVCSKAAPIASPTPNTSVNLSVPASLMGMIGEGEHYEAIHGVMVTKLTRNNPAIYAYAKRVFSTTDLTEAQWKQCEDQMKVRLCLVGTVLILFLLFFAIPTRISI